MAPEISQPGGRIADVVKATGCNPSEVLSVEERVGYLCEALGCTVNDLATVVDQLVKENEWLRGTASTHRSALMGQVLDALRENTMTCAEARALLLAAGMELETINLALGGLLPASKPD